MDVDLLGRRVALPDDAGRVADFLVQWMQARQYGLNLPSRAVLAKRVEAFTRSRPGSQIYWERDEALHATCSIQRRATGDGAQALLQLRVGTAAAGGEDLAAILDAALEHARALAPDARAAILLPRGDPLEGEISRRGFTASTALVTMMRSLREGPPRVEMPPGVTVRPLEAGRDEEMYIAVQHEAFSSDPLGAGLTASDIRHQIELGLAEPADFFLAEIEGRVVGVARCLFDADGWNPDGGPFAEIVGNGVLDPYRRRGIGQALIGAQLAHLARRGATSACLTVLSIRPELVAHYQRLGFAETGRQTIWSGPENV